MNLCTRKESKAGSTRAVFETTTRNRNSPTRRGEIRPKSRNNVFFFLGSSTRLKFLLVDTVQLTHQTAPKKTTRKIKAKTTRKVSDCRFFGCTSFRTVSTCKTTAGRQNLGIELDPTLPFLFSSFRTCWSGSNPSIASWIQGLSMLQKKILRKPILSTKVKKILIVDTICCLISHHHRLQPKPEKSRCS